MARGGLELGLEAVLAAASMARGGLGLGLEAVLAAASMGVLVAMVGG